MGNNTPETRDREPRPTTGKDYWGHNEAHTTSTPHPLKILYGLPGEEDERERDRHKARKNAAY